MPGAAIGSAIIARQRIGLPGIHGTAICESRRGSHPPRARGSPTQARHSGRYCLPDNLQIRTSPLLTSASSAGTAPLSTARTAGSALMPSAHAAGSALSPRSTPRIRSLTAGLATTAKFATVEFVESRFTLASVARTSWDRFCIICHDALFVHSASWPVKLRLSKAPMVHRSIVLRG